MSNILYIGIIILQVGVIYYFFNRSKKQAKLKADRLAAEADNTYEGLRSLALSVTPDRLKIAIPNSETLVYGVVMDWDMGDAVVTLASFITGACSMYYSMGGGIIGGGKKPGVAEATVTFVTAAQEYLDKTIPVTTTELPAKHAVRFYLLTNQRMYMAEEQMGNFDNVSSPWFPLFELANMVIAGLREDENKSSTVSN